MTSSLVQSSASRALRDLSGGPSGPSEAPTAPLASTTAPHAAGPAAHMPLAPHARSWLPPLPLSIPVTIPPEAANYPYGENVRSCTTVSQLATEYYGTATAVGSSALEARWGEGQPGIPHGGSWRSKCLRSGAPSLTSLFSAMKAMYTQLQF